MKSYDVIFWNDDESESYMVVVQASSKKQACKIARDQESSGDFDYYVAQETDLRGIGEPELI